MSTTRHAPAPGPPTPAVAVLMTVYNSAPYLEEAVRSILDQTFKDFEFIIVDDGSTDESPRLLARFAGEDPRIHLVTNEKNVGTGESSNRGIALARAPLIARQDSDDIAAKNRIELEVAFMNSRPDVGVLGSSLTVIDQEGNILEDHWNMPLSHASIVWGMLFFTTMAHPAAMYRKSVVDVVRYSADADHIANDLKLWIDLAKRGVRFANLPDCLIRYRVRTGQMGDVFGPEGDQDASRLRRGFVRFLLDNELTDFDLDRFLTVQKNTAEMFGLVQFLQLSSIGKVCARRLEERGIVQKIELEEVRREWCGTLRAIAKRQLVARIRAVFTRVERLLYVARVK